MIREVLRLCGLDKDQIFDRLAKFAGCGVDFKVEEDCLDAKIEMTSNLDKERFNEIRCAIYATFENEIYSASDIGLPQLVKHYLKTNGRTLGVAESLTGGMICQKLTAIEGISKYFYEGIVCYDKSSKILRLGVSRNTLETYGAISKQTAYEMVQGIATAPVDIGLATTGLAGPAGDEGKPVGLVYIGVGAGEFILTFEKHFKGDREQIRKCATNCALFYLLRYLMGNVWTL